MATANPTRISLTQLLKSGKTSLSEALNLLVDSSGTLNFEYLDKNLLSAMPSSWPAEQAIPLLFWNNKLYVGVPENHESSLKNSLSDFLNGCQIDFKNIKPESWNKWFALIGKTPGNIPTQQAVSYEARTQISPGVEQKTLQGALQTQLASKPVAAPQAKLGAELEATIDKIPIRQIMATDEGAIANDVRALMGEALTQRASDIHFEPTTKGLIVRFRVDGILRDVCRYFSTVQDLRKVVLARIKIIADLNIAEQRQPQDGRVTEVLGGQRVDLRVSTLPTLHGEKCVIRILPHENNFSNLLDLGMPKGRLSVYEEWLGRSQGMILITGPTGSGKTSTLYTSLAKLVDTSKNVVTVEDPVEYQLARVNQVQVNVKAGLTFSSGLRSILRQDPDIVMIGEIRDTETAEIAIQAALTGHLVLSTLHTNDAASTIVRIMDMGIEPYLIASALIGVIAQRLVRKVCSCHQEYKPSSEELELLQLTSSADEIFAKAVGCEKCSNLGYSGREGVFEIMPVNDKIQQMVQERPNLNEIKAELLRVGVPTLAHAGIQKVRKRKTTLEELLRVIPITK
ncbi:MAG: type II/IV secretion system protein [Candidatus Melainabacteria bacterium]|nr:type II/IV secretion system protein [Candidatus Melainabacteria bacterium]